MTDAERFRALAAQHVALRCDAKRGDVQEALHCLARQFAAKGRAVAAPVAAQPPLGRPMPALARAGFAPWLSLQP